VSDAGIVNTLMVRFSQKHVSAVYDVALDPHRVPYEVSVPMAQVVGPNDVDVFAFDLGFDEAALNLYGISEVLFQLSTVLHVNEDDVPIRSDVLLLCLRSPWVIFAGRGRNPKAEKNPDVLARFLALDGTLSPRLAAMRDAVRSQQP
ncbi:MAG TPA: hypothetical protein VF765_17315, partial [Polyangiaceae bacterium]